LIRNVGMSNLTLGTPILPFGYDLTSAPAAVVPAGMATSFTLTLRTDIPAGDYTGDVVFANNDSDENLFNFRVSTTVNPPVSIIDDGDAGYGDTGFTLQTPGYLGDMHTSAAGAMNVATWTFNGLTPGSVQRVSATWQPAGNLATNSPFTVNGNPVVRNQQLAPDDFTASGAAWEDLGYFVANGGGQIVVTLSDMPANGRVGADAVRIELISTPEITVYQAVDLQVDAVSSVDFSATPVGVPVQKSFTVTNDGAGLLTVGALTLPAGFSLVGPAPSTSSPLAHGVSVSFTVQLDAAMAGVYGGNLVLANGDADESPFEVVLAGTVTAGNSAPVIIDNGDLGFASTGSFALGTGSGFAGDGHLTPANAGGTSAT
jgi:hypothetical protein